MIANKLGANDHHANLTDIGILVAAMCELSRTISTADGIANAAVAEAALQLAAMNQDLADMRWAATSLRAACQAASEGFASLAQDSLRYGKTPRDPHIESAVFKVSAALSHTKRLNL